MVSKSLLKNSPPPARVIPRSFCRHGISHCLYFQCEIPRCARNGISEYYRNAVGLGRSLWGGQPMRRMGYYG